MSTGTTNGPATREQLSALADGELDGAGVGHACAGWHADAEQRSAWHAYHLIGDVMRSDDLASDVARDAAFLGALRARLALEPVVLAPAGLVRPAAAQAASRAAVRSGRWSWMAPTAVAAGFVAVAGVLVVTRSAGPVQSAPAVTSLATATPQAVLPIVPVVPVVATTVTAEPAAELPVLVANGKLIRDVQLDRYLAAHKQFAGSSALGVPSAFLRSATADASAR